MNKEYKDKYLKYKQKYINLKKLSGGTVLTEETFPILRDLLRFPNIIQLVDILDSSIEGNNNYMSKLRDSNTSNTFLNEIENIAQLNDTHLETFKQIFIILNANLSLKNDGEYNNAVANTNLRLKKFTLNIISRLFYYLDNDKKKNRLDNITEENFKKINELLENNKNIYILLHQLKPHIISLYQEKMDKFELKDKIINIGNKDRSITKK